MSSIGAGEQTVSAATRAGPQRHMDTTVSTRHWLSTVARVGRLFFRQLRGRATLVVVLLVALVVGVALAIIRNGLTLGGITGSESTDDAYVRADQIAISSHIAGYVVSIPVRDNETVKQGQVVATIEDDDYRARVADAKAALEAAQSAVDVLSGQAMVQTRNIAAASADVRAAQAGLIQTRLEHARQRELVGDGTTSRRELESAEADEDRLRASCDQKVAELEAAKHTLEVIRAQGLEAQQVAQMREAELELARIDLGYTRIVSPVDGQLSERVALRGEYVTPGTKIGLVVPLPNVWIVANFRESQMAHMNPGQTAVVTVDSVPGIRFRGVVDSFEPASGALQALLPPDNATGNFTKIAQRFAVKVILAARQAGIDRLRPGMSAIVTVAVRGSRQERRGAR
ncbi:MAG TPA: HlyD family secretion protein [Steroidobacteraceae bacterium]|nr:HlyD family secretion protein [Steroidobacteraceae bacterium]